MFGTSRKAMGTHTIGIILCFFSIVYAYSGGTGEPNNPYQIATVSDWNDLMHTPADWNACFVMTADVDLKNITLTPIGTSWETAFAGVFDGNNHIIRNVIINNPTVSYIGLFGYIRSGGQVHKLGVEDVNIKGHDYVGGLVGYNNGGSISNCYSTGTISSDSAFVGGLAGRSVGDGNISGCYAAGAITGNEGVGGLIGHNDMNSIIACYAEGMVNGSNYVGGLVGNNYYGYISDCYSRSAVNGSQYVGGLVGYLVGSNVHGTINNCYSTGSVVGQSTVGGLIGRNYGSGITGCFWDIQTSGQTSSYGGTGKTTEQMLDVNTFLDVGWDFNTPVWKICQGENYPKLAWQIPYGNFVCPDGVSFEDLAYFLLHWMSTNCGENNDCDGTDINKDGVVNFIDFAAFAHEWNCIIGKASNPQPTDGAINVSPDVILRWIAGNRTLERDVYLGTDANAVATANRLSPEFMGTVSDVNFDPYLSFATTYFWRIDEVGLMCITKGDVWSFTTYGYPGKATSPFPFNGDFCFDPNVVLMWVAGAFTDSHDVYLGTDFNDVNNAGISSPEFKGNQTTANYGPCELEANTTYFWRIDEKNAYGTTKGDVWNFTVPPLSLVGWWKFDEGSGTIANDSAGDNNGIVYGGAVWTTGQINGALSFDGSNDYVEVPDDDNCLDMDNQMTISAWIKVNDSNNDYFIVTKQPSGTAGHNYPGNYVFSIKKTTGYLQLSHQTGTGHTSASYTSTTAIAVGIWQHVAVTLEEGTAVLFYINDEIAGMFPQTATFGITNNEPVRIGTRKDDYSYFNGAIDDVRIYNRALSRLEIQ